MGESGDSRCSKQTPEYCRICEADGHGGTFLPLFGEWEQNLLRELRFVVYLLFLGWLFMGVAIIADVFMGAIERVTAKKVRRYNAKLGKNVTVLVWNETVANLTLMALGSSAPEILLSVIELLLGDFFSGDLGPSTIVGSAAFNLLMIIAVCITAVPFPETRKIKEFNVYIVTAVFSLFAYFWLIIILKWTTPNVVTILEGVLTFLFFPILVWIAYATDQGFFSCEDKAPDLGHGHILDSKEQLAELHHTIQKEHSGKLSNEEVMEIIFKQKFKANKAHYRSMAVRSATGGKPIHHPLKDSEGLFKKSPSEVSSGKTRFGFKTKSFTTRTSKIFPMEDEQNPALDLESKSIVEFTMASKAVLENAGHVLVELERKQQLDKPCSIYFLTEEGSAKFEQDFKKREGWIHFDKNQDKAEFKIDITDDNAYEEDEEFYVTLLVAPSAEHTGGDVVGIAPQDKEKVEVALGEKSKMTVMIIDDDCPGVISFEKEEMYVEQEQEDKFLSIRVCRQNGSTGKIEVSYETEEDTAIAGKDFEHTKGKIVFEDGAREKSFNVKIMARGRYETKELFRVILKDATGGATFDPSTDGGADVCILTVFIMPNEESRARVDKLMMMCNVNWDRAKIGHENWADQFKSAVLINGGEEDEDDDQDRLVFLFRLAENEVDKFDATKFQDEFKVQLTKLAEKFVEDLTLSMGIDGHKVTALVSQDTARRDVEEIRKLMGTEKLIVMGKQAEVKEWEHERPSLLVKVIHLITVPWKLLFAIVPPVDYCNGWLTFCCSLGFIGIVTAYIGELAMLVGCVIDLPDLITAITVVALGTSLPDTFASKTAAIQDDHADASIVNVTGSNSVNVFLGLGLPWMVGAIRWEVGGSDEKWDAKFRKESFAKEYLGEMVNGNLVIPSGAAAFVVEAGDLVFSVTVFSACALTCIAILYARRIYLDGELGGPNNFKYASSITLVCLWLTYIGLSTWYTLSHVE